MAYTKYSLTPADNNAAPPNGAPEGMLPSGVNDTMRDMMSQIRDVGDGIRGGTYTMTAPVITGGSINDTIIGATTATTATFTTATVNRVADSQGGSVAPISSVMRNRIINGAMVVNQRGGTVTSGASGTFGVDRFASYASGGGVFTAVQSSTVPTGEGFVSSNLLTVTTVDSSIASGEYYSYAQSVEGYNIADLNWGTASAKTVTFSFWVNSSVTGLYAVAFYNADASRCYPATFTISAANTWQKVSITILGPTDGTWNTTNGIGVGVRFDLGSGSSYNGTANTWNASGAFVGVRTSSTVNWIANSGATFYITGVQLEVGTQATGFEYRQYQQELALCQRYYQQIGYTLFSGYVVTGNSYYSIVFYKVSMRANPTIVYTNGGANGFPTTASSSNQISTEQLTCTRVANSTVNAGFFVDAITMSAEL
jgi:hypothetical protein